jgi:hypothetical protein
VLILYKDSETLYSNEEHPLSHVKINAQISKSFRVCSVQLTYGLEDIFSKLPVAHLRKQDSQFGTVTKLRTQPSNKAA